MKKIISLIAVASVILCFGACGKDVSLKQNSSAKIQNSQSQEQVTGAENESSKTEYENYEEFEMFALKATIEPTVLVDEKDVKITANAITYNSYEAELEITIENNTGKNLSFTSGSIGYCVNSVNGYMVTDGYVNVDLPAGKKTNEAVSFGANQLALLGITDIADIEIGFEISDDDYDEYLKTGPIQIKTSIANSYDYSKVKFGNAINNGYLAEKFKYDLDLYSADEIYNDSGIIATAYAVITNAGGEQVLFVEYKNTSEEIIYVSAEQFELNGIVAYGGVWSSELLYPSKSVVVSYSLESILEKSYQKVFGIDKINNVKFNISLYNEEYGKIVAAKNISIDLLDAKYSVDTSGDEIYNENGIKIVKKGIIDDPSEYSNDIEILLLVENKSGALIDVDTAFDSMFVNDFMIYESTRGAEIQNNKYGIMKISLMESDLEENSITSIGDIETIEFKLEIKDENYNTIDEPTITIGDELASGKKPTETPEPTATPTPTPKPTATPKPTLTPEPTEKPQETNTEWQQFLIDYEAWVDEYIVFMQKYSKNPTDLTLIMDYTSLMTEMAEWAENSSTIQDELSNEDLAVYMETMLRITNKLNEAAMSLA